MPDSDKEGVVESRVFQLHTWQRMIVVRILDGMDGWIDFFFFLFPGSVLGVLGVFSFNAL